MRLSEIITEVSERVGDLKDVVNYGVNNKTGIEISNRKVSEDTSTYKIIRKNYFAYNPYRVNVGSIGLFNGEIGAVSPAYIVFKINEEKIIPQLLVRFLKSKKGIFEINKHTHGGVRKSLSIKDLGKIEINVPSIEIQKQFIEGGVENRNLMDSLNLKTEENKELIKKLRQSILQDAIQGKLIEQNANDEPASELLKKIKVEKEKMVKEGKIKKEKPLAPIIDEDKPFDIPSNWVWVRLGEIINIKSGDGLTSNDMVKGNIPVYGGNGITGYHNIGNIEKETIVIGRVGYYCGSVHITPKEARVTDNAFITTYPEEYIDKQFFVYLLKQLNLGYDSNATAQPVVSGKKIYPILMPLPPFEEQKRIVAKLDKLMKLCDELEEKINSTGEEGENLIDSIFQNIFKAS